MPNSLPIVNVLLATFNGEKFLHEQLQSLVSQNKVTVRVYVNDDGSTDETLAILEAWKEKGLIVEITHSLQVGPTSAFLKLLAWHNNADYVAFCDQDDVWRENKLFESISQIGHDGPHLIFSSRSYIDKNGSLLGHSKKLRRPPSFENALIENIAPGNTLLLNKSAIKIVNSYDNPKVCHYDSWIYLLISGLGTCIYIESGLVKYRIHKHNFVGVSNRRLRAIFRSVEYFTNQIFCLQAVAIDDLSSEKRDLIKMITTYIDHPFRKIAIGYRIHKRVYRQRNFETFLVIILMAAIKNSLMKRLFK
jgi:glycosyltransferase involved in cell wall biosynthesis